MGYRSRFLADKSFDMRYQRDKNHSEIVKAAGLVGATVLDLSQVGGGCPDILIGYRGLNYLIEIKNNDTFGKLNERQKLFVDNWRGHVAEIREIDELITEITGKTLV